MHASVGAGYWRQCYLLWKNTKNNPVNKMHEVQIMKKKAVTKFLANAGAIGMALSMMVTPVTAASAAPVAGVSGEQTDVAAAQVVTVSGLKKGSTVKLYQIVDGYYKDGKLVKYVLMDPKNGAVVAIGNDAAGQNAGHNDIITEAEITTIANNIQGGAFTADKGVDMTVGTTADKDGHVSATASVEPGLYMVLATDPTGVTVYNPAVVAVNITDVNKNTAAGGSVDMTRFFTTANGTTDSNVYLKSSDSGLDKKITGSTKAAVEAEGDATGKKAPVGNYGDTIAVGDTQHFKLDGMTIPSFSADYTNPKYIITDTIDTAFDQYTNLVVKVGGKAVTASDTTYTITANGNGFIITFAEGYLKSLRGLDNTARACEVSYDAVLNSTAGLNFAENHNRAEIKYSNSPTAKDSFNTIDKDVYTYTFGIDAALDGENAGEKITYEFNKVTGKHKTFANQKFDAPLAGATFTLYSDEACTKVAKTALQSDGTAISDADGHITFSGLDEGTYYLKETQAPAGYALADQTYKFVIKANLGADGIMTDYSVKTSYKDATHPDWTDAAAASYKSTATKEKDGSVTNKITRTDAPIAIVDSKFQNLPSTGGRGTVALTLVATAGMAGFLAVYLSSRKKKA